MPIGTLIELSMMMMSCFTLWHVKNISIGTLGVEWAWMRVAEAAPWRWKSVLTAWATLAKKLSPQPGVSWHHIPKKNDMTTKFVESSKKVDLGSSRLEQRMLSCVSSSGLFSCLNNECCYISHNWYLSFSLYFKPLIWHNLTTTSFPEMLLACAPIKYRIQIAY